MGRIAPRAAIWCTTVHSGVAPGSSGFGAYQPQLNHEASRRGRFGKYLGEAGMCGSVEMTVPVPTEKGSKGSDIPRSPSRLGTAALCALRSPRASASTDRNPLFAMFCRCLDRCLLRGHERPIRRCRRCAPVSLQGPRVEGGRWICKLGRRGSRRRIWKAGGVRRAGREAMDLQKRGGPATRG